MVLLPMVPPSLANITSYGKTFSEIHHLSDEEKKSTMKSIEQWWKKYIFRGISGQEIAQEQFLNRLNQEFKSNKEEFIKDKRNYFSTILGVIDINHDKFIDQVEFVLCFRAYGHENLTADTDFFNAYKPVDGKVPVKVIVDSWTDFLTSEYSSKESIEKNAFESVQTEIDAIVSFQFAMANAFLVSKWKIWYNSLDVNHDGMISFADVEENKFSELHNLDAKQKKDVIENFEKWWNQYIFRKRKGEEISEKEFLDMLNNDFKTDKAKFLSEMEACFKTLFNVIDTNQDRSISEDEFLIAFKAYGHENVALDTKFFKSYNPDKDGLVPLMNIVNSWIQFTTSEDESKPDVVKAAFESGV
ncbi:SCP-like protein [Mya arenaria]|uniref:SCP-like protein n=1 Tax=Mya arenaria TaxID=6604 RepID=A0ABY7D829_MYAAR|nr:SCP-like protein [Mya arenaria]